MAGTLRRLTAGSAVLITALFGTVACGSGSSSTAATTSPASGGSSAASSLPAAIKSSGVLRVGTNVPFVPMEQYGPDGKTFQGIDLDLITAVADNLGLKVQIANANWDGLIPALNAGRYDVLAASFGDFVERQKVVDLVDMLKGGVSGITKSGDAAKYTDATSLCGKDVGVESGSATVQIAKTLSATCQKDGKSAIGQHVFPTDAGAVVALQSGRVDVVLDDTVVAQHLAATQSSRYAYVLPGLGSPFYYAFVVSKKDPALSKAIQRAVNALIANGTYAKICAKYGITGGSLVTSATVDAGTTSVNSA
jgi:polar amino acid transport system substrate-binding protein